MAFKENQRIEQIYFSNLKRTIDVLRRWKEGETDLKTADVLQALIDADSAILMMYKNLGEAYAETVSMIEEEKAGLVSLQAELTDFKGEINAKIDDVNNYLVSRLQMTEENVSVIENYLLNTTRVRLYYIDTIDESSNEAILYNWWDDQNANGETISDELNNSGIIPILIDTSEQLLSHNFIVAFPSQSVYEDNLIVFQAFTTDYMNGGRYINIYSYELEDDGTVNCRANSFDFISLAEQVEISNVLLIAEKQQNNYYRVYMYGDPSHNYLDFVTISAMADIKANMRVRAPINNNGGYVEIPYSYNDGDYLAFSTYLVDADGDMRCASLLLDAQSENDFTFDYYVV